MNTATQSSELQRAKEQVERNKANFKQWQYKVFHATNHLPVKRATYPVFG